MEHETEIKTARHGILNLTIKDKETLYKAYMPYIANGAIFIPTNKKYEMGDEIFMLLNLMDELEKIAIACKVVWLTPAHAQGNKTEGIGVQFSEEDGPALRDKIEGYLAGMLASEKSNHTI